MRLHKISTDALYIAVALISLTTLLLSTFIFIQADNTLKAATTAQRAAHHTSRHHYYQTDDLAEYVQTYTLRPANLSLPNTNPPQRNTILHSGAKITLHHPNGEETLCTLTVINETHAITAGHCAQLGDLVYAHTRTEEKIPIGTVTNDSLLNHQHPEPGSLDTATITLNTTTIGNPHPLRAETPNIGDPVTLHGQRTQGSQGRVVSTTETYNHTVPVFRTDALVRGGDSGGPAYDHDGNLIGTIQFSVNNGESGITPLSNICDNDPALKCGTHRGAEALK